MVRVRMTPNYWGWSPIGVLRWIWFCARFVPRIWRFQRSARFVWLTIRIEINPLEE